MSNKLQDTKHYCSTCSDLTKSSSKSVPMIMLHLKFPIHYFVLGRRLANIPQEP